jgi:hypothetical protein
MQKRCEKCQEWFEAKRSTARFCSDACGKAARRGAPVLQGTTEVSSNGIRGGWEPEWDQPFEDPTEREREGRGIEGL